MDAGIGVTGIQSIGPGAAQPFKANRKERENIHADVLQSIRVGKFPLQQYRAAFLKKGSAFCLQQRIERHAVAGVVFCVR